MILTNDNEEQRSQIWRISVVAASIMIIAVGAYFLHKMFTENPIMGTWVSQTRDITLTIDSDGEMEVTGADFYMEGIVSYHMNTESKSISFTLSQGSVVDDTEDLVEAVTYTSTYNYSVEQEVLTLTDMEFGNVENFIKL